MTTTHCTCSWDCCFDEINVSDNWWWELITGTIICVWSVYICSPALCPCSAHLRAVMRGIITRLQPVISDIYHIHYDHNATVGTQRSKREMARTIVCLFLTEWKVVYWFRTVNLSVWRGNFFVSQENNPIKCQNFGHLVILRKTQTLDWQSLFVAECWLSCCPRLNLAS